MKGREEDVSVDSFLIACSVSSMGFSRVEINHRMSKYQTCLIIRWLRFPLDFQLNKQLNIG